MGATISSVFNRLFGKKEYKILMVGLDAAGKTSILYKLKFDAVVTSTPIIGYNVEKIQHKNISMAVWDLGGGDKIKSLWVQYFEECHGLILVVDSCDRERIKEAGDLLHFMINNGKYHNGALLILGNKQDLPNPMSESEIIKKLRLDELRVQSWHFQESCAIDGRGLYEGLDWLAKEIDL